MPVLLRIIILETGGADEGKLEVGELKGFHY